jgi:hypothetical protein
VRLEKVINYSFAGLYSLLKTLKLANTNPRALATPTVVAKDVNAIWLQFLDFLHRYLLSYP